MDIVAQPSGGRSGALLSDIIHARMCGGLGDLLLVFLDFGIGYGMGLPLERPADPTTRAMLDKTLERWHAEAARTRAMAGDPDAADATLAALPEWLRALPDEGVRDG